jgi:hypothetical protein
MAHVSSRDIGTIIVEMSMGSTLPMVGAKVGQSGAWSIF